MNWTDIISKLELKPLPQEGGYYRETYRSSVKINCPDIDDAVRNYSTAIYYLITPSSFSALHRVKQDEIFHFYVGSPVEMVIITDSGEQKFITIGPDIMSGQIPQVIVPKNTWQGTKLLSPIKDSWALLGTTVSPGFEFMDFELGRRENLLNKFPELRLTIEKYTHN